MSDLKNTEATVEHFEAYSAAYLALICNAAIINGVIAEFGKNCTLSAKT
jgi:hypothetical protein